VEDYEFELAVRAATEALAGQQSLLDQAEATPVPVDVAAAEAHLEAAEAALRALEKAPDERDLEEARLNVEVAKNTLWATQLEEDMGGMLAPSSEVVRARAAAAEQTLRIAEVQYERVKSGATEDALTGARAVVAEAQAAVDRLKRGASEEELDGLHAAVHSADVALEQARWQLDQVQVLAPFAGTVVEVLVRPGERVLPGAPVITMADLSHLRVQTTDLDELDLARVSVGQTVNLTFDALPDDVLQGQVTRIADRSLTGQGSASFAVVVELDEQDPRLRWGMSAFVDIAVE
jgi:multidrug resistance efflux pump